MYGFAAIATRKIYSYILNNFLVMFWTPASAPAANFLKNPK